MGGEVSRIISFQEGITPMCLWAIVPVKPLRRGKSRLAQVLTNDEREQLNNAMLEHVLQTLSEVPQLDQILVMSRDPAALALARDYRARTVLEDGHPDLNTALKRATKFSQAYSTCGVLIVPADLPLMTSQDIETLILAGSQPPVIAISPDRKGVGTNALLVSPSGLINYCYGPDSFHKHLNQAHKASAKIEICNLPNLALDIDDEEDLEYYRQVMSQQNSMAVYAQQTDTYLEAK
jgi:2-phospho-L-lactate/phosphoenolpyruvate guanylyltransferase